MTDLSGNVLWALLRSRQRGSKLYRRRQDASGREFPDGNWRFLPAFRSAGPLPAGTINELREVDLAGDTVREISINDLNSRVGRRQLRRV